MENSEVVNAVGRSIYRPLIVENLLDGSAETA